MSNTIRAIQIRRISPCRRPLTVSTKVFGLLSLACAMVAASNARAVVFQVDGISVSSGVLVGTHAFIPVGGTVTIGARMADPTATTVTGVGASYSGWNPSILSFVSGSTVDSIFHAQCPNGSGGSDGMTNLVPNPLVESKAAIGGPVPGAPRVRTIVALSVDPRAAHVDDPGLDGQCGGGDAQMRLTFQAVADGETTLTIGTGEDLGSVVSVSNGTIAQATNATVTVTVPEPAGVASIAAGLLLLGALFLRPSAPSADWRNSSALPRTGPRTG
ncbi:MAG: hypothetical protein IPK00_24595 [Deltaproteobacteria bacterium]|nr:hypothetical protein [Deltaproteobacteria bacterium]